MTDQRFGVLSRLREVEAFDVRNVPEALAQMLTDSDNGWSEICELKRLNLLDWLAENLSAEEVCLFLNHFAEVRGTIPYYSEECGCWFSSEERG